MQKSFLKKIVLFLAIDSEKKRMVPNKNDG